MSRRRRRDAEEDGDVLSEDEDRNRRRALSGGSNSEIEDELDVSEYESVEEEERESSDDEINETPVEDPANSKPQQLEPTHKMILERKPEDQNHENRIPPDESSKLNEDQEEKVEEDDNHERGSGDGKEESDTEYAKSELGKNNDEKAQEDDPAFIPTKGAFFQHDMRSEDQPKSRGKERRLWDKGPVKWKHDMFIMEEQMPKSKDILISNYGYDIRELPLDAPPPVERRPRGRGRGGGRGRGRGRRNYPRGRQQVEDENRVEVDDDFPALDNQENDAIKQKSRSYYSKQKYQSRPNEDQMREERSSRKVADDSRRKATAEQKTNLAPSGVEKENDEKFSDILQVIRDRENASPAADAGNAPQALNTSRKTDRHPRNHNTSYSNYHEAPKPRRYSSLRQRQSDPRSDNRNSQNSPRSREQKYANFSKPMQPSPLAGNDFGKKSLSTKDTSKLINNDITNQTAELLQSSNDSSKSFQPPHMVMPQANQTSVAQMPLNLQSMTFTDPNQPTMGAPLDPSLMAMPQMFPLYNPMLNSSYIDAASNYQRMLRMMSQMNMSMDQLQHIPTSMAPPMDANASGIPPDPQSLPLPGDMPMNPVIPPASQNLSVGTMGSVMRPPHTPLNPPTYFTSPMPMNMPQQQQQQQQQPLGYPPNMVAQQVGGVTYFNTATHSPPVQQPNNQASPRRNAAIPIMAPTGFGGPSGLE